VSVVPWYVNGSEPTIFPLSYVQRLISRLSMRFSCKNPVFITNAMNVRDASSTMKYVNSFLGVICSSCYCYFVYMCFHVRGLVEKVTIPLNITPHYVWGCVQLHLACHHLLRK
jgi:hypothetical protein